MYTVELVKYKGKKILVRKETGEVGSIYNPYSFKEYRFHFNKHFVKVHIGMVQYVEIDGRRNTKNNLSSIIVDCEDIRPIIDKVDMMEDVFECKCGNKNINYIKDPNTNEYKVICKNCNTLLFSYTKTKETITIN